MALLLLLTSADWRTSLGAIRDTQSVALVPLVVKRVPDSIDAAAYAVAKSPGRAAWLSALVPGGGQFYNGHWWKGLLLGGLECFLATQAGLRYADYRQNGNDTTLMSSLNYAFFFVGAWGFSVADAYAFAYMHDFARRDSLVEKEVEPEVKENGP